MVNNELGLCLVRDSLSKCVQLELESRVRHRDEVSKPRQHSVHVTRTDPEGSHSKLS